MPDRNFFIWMDLNSVFQRIENSDGSQRPFQAKKGARVQKNYIRKIESRFVGIRKSTGRGSSFSGTNEKGRQAQERTETAMDNTQHTYFAELKLALQKAGYTVQAVEDGHLPIEWNDRRLCQVTESGGIRFRTDDTTDPAAEAAPKLFALL